MPPDLAATLLTGRNAAIPAMAVVFTYGLRTWLAPWFDTPRGQRTLPVVPLLVAVLLALLGVGDLAADGWHARLVLGVTAGAVAMAAWKVGKTTVLGGGLDPAPIDRSIPPAGPAAPPPPPPPPPGPPAT